MRSKVENQVKKYFRDKKIKDRLAHSNNETVIDSFLHGCQLEHRKLFPYVFVPKTKENMEILEARQFEEFSERVDDDIFKMGAIHYNKKFNLFMIVVPNSEWEIVSTSIDIAISSTKNFTSQCQILTSARKILKVKNQGKNDPTLQKMQ